MTWNQNIKAFIEQGLKDNDKLRIEHLYDAFNQEAEKLDKVNIQIKPWITEDTYKIIEQKRIAEFEHSGNKEQINKELGKAKKTDWKSYAHNLINIELDIQDKWLGIKFLKKKHQPKLYEAAGIDIENESTKSKKQKQRQTTSNMFNENPGKFN